MTNEKVHEGIIKKVQEATGAALTAIERCDAKTDAAISHLVASRRTLLWILIFVVMDFVFGVYAGLKL